MSPHRASAQTQPISLLYVPCPSAKMARQWAKDLVEERLAACGNVVDRMHSVYMLQGEIVDELESLLFIKTNPSRVDALMTRLTELHNYETPCIVVLQAQVNSAYADWVAQQTAA